MPEKYKFAEEAVNFFKDVIMFELEIGTTYFVAVEELIPKELIPKRKENEILKKMACTESWTPT